MARILLRITSLRAEAVAPEKVTESVTGVEAESCARHRLRVCSFSLFQVQFSKCAKIKQERVHVCVGRQKNTMQTQRGY